jgi:hypothetical protein
LEEFQSTVKLLGFAAIGRIARLLIAVTGEMLPIFYRSTNASNLISAEDARNSVLHLKSTPP